MPNPHPRTRHRRHIYQAVALIVLALATTPATTQAGTFTVHSCTTPNGTWTGMDGWTSSASLPAAGQDSGVAGACTVDNEEIRLDFGVMSLPVSVGRWVEWSYAAAPSTHITSLTLLRSFELGWPVVPNTYGRPYVYDAWHDQDVAENQLEFYFPPFGGNTLGAVFDPLPSQSGVSWDSISLRVRCWESIGNHDCGPFRAKLRVPRATIGLSDDKAPTATVSGGSLAGGGPVRGMADLTFDASDEGGGVYRSILSVDGEEVARDSIDAGASGCADVEPGNDDPYEFGGPQPCPLDVAGEVQFNTSALHDGPHTFRISVEDAAGNVSLVRQAVVATHNAPISTVAPALAGTAAVGAQLSTGVGGWDGVPSAYGYRWLRCEADGSDCAGIAGADEATYALAQADAYHRVAVEVTAENGSGDATARSALSAKVADAAGRTTRPPSGPGDANPAPGAGGIGGLSNPLGDVDGHVANGAGATGSAHIEVAFRLAQGKTARRVRSSLARRWMLVGRLVGADGRGIADARLAATWKVTGQGWAAHGSVRTGADGRFAWVLPAGPSRQVKLAYFAFSDSQRFVTSNVLQEDVLAPLTIRADRTRTDVDRTVRLSGRAGGPLIPRGGVLVALQGFQTGFGWRTFRTVRTTRNGAWTTSYRFRLSHGRFGFRAVVPQQSGYPFVTTRSKAVYVAVLG